MTTPPPFGTQYQEPRRRNNTLLIALLIGVPIVACIGFIAFGLVAGLSAFRQVAPTIGCAATYGYIQSGLKAYVKEHDGKLPPAATWQDDIVPFVLKAVDGEEKIPFIEFQPRGEWTCGAGDVVYGIAFNTAFSEAVVADIENPADAVLVFETTERGRNLHETYEPKDPATAPSRFGNKGWITMTADWEVRGLGSENGKIEVNVGNDKTPNSNADAPQ